MLNFENFLVRFSRKFWLFLASIFFVFILISFVLALYSFTLAKSSVPRISSPDWSEIEVTIFPPSKEAKNEEPIIVQESKQNTNYTFFFNKSDIDKLLESILLHFNDSKNNIDQANLFFTPSSIDSYIYTRVNDYEVINSIDYSKKSEFILDINRVFIQAAEKNALKKLGNFQDRVNYTQLIIDRFILGYGNNVQSTLNQRVYVENINKEKNQDGINYLIILASSLGLFILIVLFILIFRVESHLKEISKKWSIF